MINIARKNGMKIAGMDSKKTNILLNPIRMKDAEVLMELNNNPEISKYVVGNPVIVDMKQQLMWMNNLATEENTKRWIITYDGTAVGTIILNNIDLKNLVGNMNIKLLPSSQGKGIAKSALKEACRIAFDEVGLYCLTANVLDYNIKSQRLFEALGFHKDGILRSRVVKDSERHDLFTYSLLKDDLKLT